MHEAGVASSILSTVMGALPKPRAKITKIIVVAGALSAIERSSLELYFHELSKDTPAENATIELRHERAKLVCRDCEAEREFDPNAPVVPVCEKCGGHNKLVADSGVYVDSMEVEN